MIRVADRAPVEGPESLLSTAFVSQTSKPQLNKTQHLSHGAESTYTLGHMVIAMQWRHMNPILSEKLKMAVIECHFSTFHLYFEGG